MVFEPTIENNLLCPLAYFCAARINHYAGRVYFQHRWANFQYSDEPARVRLLAAINQYCANVHTHTHTN